MARGNVGKTERDLLEAAFLAKRNAHVLWGFNVGSAVLASDRKIYEGCNVESWISGLGICAERCAINHAILHGNTKIMEIAIVMDSKRHNEPSPCGACLQYIHDFADNSELKIISGKADADRILYETVNVKTVKEMFPFPYKK